MAIEIKRKQNDFLPILEKLDSFMQEFTKEKIASEFSALSTNSTGYNDYLEKQQKILDLTERLKVKYPNQMEMISNYANDLTNSLIKSQNLFEDIQEKKFYSSLDADNKKNISQDGVITEENKQKYSPSDILQIKQQIEDNVKKLNLSPEKEQKVINTALAAIESNVKVQELKTAEKGIDDYIKNNAHVMVKSPDGTIKNLGDFLENKPYLEKKYILQNIENYKVNPNITSTSIDFSNEGTTISYKIFKDKKGGYYYNNGKNKVSLTPKQIDDYRREQEIIKQENQINQKNKETSSSITRNNYYLLDPNNNKVTPIFKQGNNYFTSDNKKIQVPLDKKNLLENKIFFLNDGSIVNGVTISKIENGKTKSTPYLVKDNTLIPVNSIDIEGSYEDKRKKFVTASLNSEKMGTYFFDITKGLGFDYLSKLYDRLNYIESVYNPSNYTTPEEIEEAQDNLDEAIDNLKTSFLDYAEATAPKTSSEIVSSREKLFDKLVQEYQNINKNNPNKTISVNKLTDKEILLDENFIRDYINPYKIQNEYDSSFESNNELKFESNNKLKKSDFKLNDFFTNGYQKFGYTEF